MAEYISKEVAINFIKENQCKKCSDIGLCGGCAVLTAIKLFQAIPAADVAPRMYAKNICYKAKGHCEFKCSLCGVEIGVVEGGELDGGYFNFCPNCGAKMDE